MRRLHDWAVQQFSFEKNAAGKSNGTYVMSPETYLRKRSRKSLKPSWPCSSHRSNMKCEVWRNTALLQYDAWTSLGCHLDNARTVHDTNQLDGPTCVLCGRTTASVADGPAGRRGLLASGRCFGSRSLTGCCAGSRRLICASHPVAQAKTLQAAPAACGRAGGLEASEATQPGRLARGGSECRRGKPSMPQS